MNNLVFKILSTAPEISMALDKFEITSGVRLPIEYAMDAKVVGVFLHDQLSACYMLVTKPNFRSLMFVPDEIRKTGNLSKIDNYEMMEVNGLWIGPSLKRPILQVKVWIHLILDIFSSKKNYVLLMRDSRIKSMKKLMNMASPTSIYNGSPKLLAGETTHSEIEVGYTTRWKIILNAHKYLFEYWNRQRRAGEFRKQQDLARALKQTEARYV